MQAPGLQFGLTNGAEGSETDMQHDFRIGDAGRERIDYALARNEQASQYVGRDVWFHSFDIGGGNQFHVVNAVVDRFVS